MAGDARRDGRVSLRVRREALSALRAHAADLDNGGRVVFLVGGPGSGRSATLRAFADGLRGGRGQRAVTAFRFCSPHEVVSLSDDQAGSRRTDAALSTVAAAGTAAALVPILAPALVGVALLAQLAQAVGGAGQAAQKLAALRTRGVPSEPDDLLTMLRIAERATPVVCVLDDFSRADLVWWRLFLRDSAPELVRLRVLLVVAVDDAPPGDESVVHHAQLAEGFGRRGGHVIRLGPFDPAEVEAQVGPLAEPLRTDLAELANGAAGPAEDLWAELLSDGAVTHDHGRWRWAPGRGPAGPAAGGYVGFVRQLLDRRIRDLCRTPEEEAAGWAVARMAAIEGVRCTPAAVVTALQRLGVPGFADPDEALDLVDDVLAGDRPGAILASDERPLSWRSGGEDRHAYRATWVSAGHAEALLRLGLTDDERRRWATALGHALEEVYGGLEQEMSGTLARVWTLAGETEHAALALRQRIRFTSEAQLRRLVAAEAVGRVDHLLYVGHAIHVAALLARSEPMRAIEMGRSGLRVAEESGVPAAVIAALLAIGNPMRGAQLFRDALPLMERARTLAQSNGSGRRLWQATYQLTSCHLGQHECSCRDHVAEAARLAEELRSTAVGEDQHRMAEAIVAQVLRMRRRPGEALPIYLRCVDMVKATGDAVDQQYYQRQAAICLIDLERYAEAIVLLADNHRLASALDDAVGVAMTLYEWAYAARRLGDLDEACRLWLDAADAWQALGSPKPIILDTLRGLEQIARERGQEALAEQVGALRDAFRLDDVELAAAAAEDPAVAALVSGVRDLGGRLRELHAAASV